VPPLYMIVFAIGEAPTTSFIGNNASALSWQVRHPVGESSGSSTQCFPPANTGHPFTINANVTDTLATCEPWGLTLIGGTPPYNVILAAPDSPVITNVTFGDPKYSVLTYINRVEEGRQLI
ncbi:hypothetical protein C8R46DRAFT_867728, partial [Mycena filopes]